MSAPLTTAVERLTLDAANPPTDAVIVLRLWNRLDDGTAEPEPTGNLGGSSRRVVMLFNADPSFAAEPVLVMAA
jgi:hypothetical protein